MPGPFTDLTALAGHLRDLATAGNPLMLDATVLPPEAVTRLGTGSALPTAGALTVVGVQATDVPDPAGGLLTIHAGTTSLFALDGCPVRLTFAVAGDGVQVTAAVTLPVGWAPADTFPNLNGFPFDRFTVTRAAFVFSSVDRPGYRWPDDDSPTVPVSTGATFVADVQVAAVPLAATVLGADLPDTLRLCGPFAPVPGRSLPVGTLTAALGSGGFSVGAGGSTLSLAAPRLAVEIGAGDDVNPLQSIDLLVLGDVQGSVTVSVAIPVTGDAYAVRAVPLPDRRSVTSLIESLPGGAGFTDYIPAELGTVFSDVGLDGLTLRVDTTPAVTSLGLTLSTVNPWPVIPDLLTLSALALRVQIVDPAGRNWTTVSLTARAAFLPRVFPDPLDFTVALERRSGWQVGTISGAYPGSLRLGDMVAGLLGTPGSVPAALQGITFSALGVSATRVSAGEPFTYACHGSTEVALTLFETQLTAYLALRFAGTANGYDIQLAGALVIGAEAFTLALDLGTAGAVLTATWTSTGAPLTLGDIAAALGWDGIPTALGALVLPLTSATLLADLSAGRLNLTASSTTPVDLLPGGPTLTGLTVAVGRTPANDDTPVQVKGSVQATLRLAAEQPYTLAVSAELASGGGGLRFEGSTGPGQQILIGGLIQQLASRFGAVTLPAALAGLTVQNLHVAFDTAAGSFSFAAESGFPLDGGRRVAVTVTIDLTRSDGVYTAVFGGTVTIGALAFDLHVSQSGDVTFCVATYRHLAGQVGQGSTLDVRALVAQVSTQVADLVPTDLQVELKDVLVAIGRTAGATRFLLGVDIGAGLSLSSLPLVGQQFGADATAAVDDLRLVVASADLLRSEVTVVNGLLPTGVAPLPMPEAPDAAPGDVVLTAGPTVSARLTLGGTSQALVLPTGAPVPKTATAAAVASTAGDDGTKWFAVQRTFGPVTLARVGVRYRDAVLFFLLDAALSAAGLTLSLDGLGIGSPVTRFDPQVTLRGLGVDYRTDAVEIGAAFLRTTVTDAQGRTYDEYDGAAVLKAKVLTLSAIGSYAYLDGHPSLFLYAILRYPIGGPSFFFVTGLAAGFGYNRDLVVPPVDQVATFPLVAEVTGPPPTTSAQSPAAALTGELEKLRAFVPPAIGQNFLAVGIAFTSFQMIDSFALLTVSFGRRLEVNVLGLSTAVFPTPVPGTPAVTPLAEVQLALKASFLPGEGFLGVAAQLTSNSYVLSRDCRLTGGFAFSCWFPTTDGGPAPHAGDFVLSLGGYHPDYRVPAHYPQVPRLGINWKVSDQLTVKGQAYVALTPAALMAGVLMDATWDGGDLVAWFHAGADFIVAWKPYHYDGHAFAALHVSYRFEFFGTHEIRVDASADLHVWGPEFSGRATVRVSIVEFDVSFGAQAPVVPAAITWPEFAASFLPAAGPGGAPPCCSIAATDGLTRTVPGAGTVDVPDLGVLNPTRLALSATSVVPVTRATAGAAVDLTGLGLTPVGIAPMDVAPGALTSALAVTITRADGTAAESLFRFAPVVKPVPAALWGGSLAPTVDGAALLDRSLAGFTITPADGAEPAGGRTLGADGWQYTDADAGTWAWDPAPPSLVSGPVATADAVRATVAAAGTVAARNLLLAGLGFAPVPGPDPSIADRFAPV